MDSDSSSDTTNVDAETVSILPPNYIASAFISEYHMHLADVKLFHSKNNSYTIPTLTSIETNNYLPECQITPFLANTYSGPIVKNSIQTWNRNPTRDKEECELDFLPVPQDEEIIPYISPKEKRSIKKVKRIKNKFNKNEQNDDDDNDDDLKDQKISKINKENKSNKGIKNNNDDDSSDDEFKSKLTK
jgi:hypothetical protein